MIIYNKITKGTNKQQKSLQATENKVREWCSIKQSDYELEISIAW